MAISTCNECDQIAGWIAEHRDLIRQRGKILDLITNMKQMWLSNDIEPSDIELYRYKQLTRKLQQIDQCIDQVTTELRFWRKNHHHAVLSSIE